MRQEKAEQIEIFSVKEEGEHLVASKWRWDDCQRERKSQEEKAWKESQGLEEEDKRKWCAAHEDAARKMLKYPEDNEDLKVGLSEVKEQLETPEEACFSIMQIAKQESSSRSSGKKRMRCTSPGEVGYTTERIGGAGKALSGTDAGGGDVKRRTRSSGWLCGRPEQIAE